MAKRSGQKASWIDRDRFRRGLFRHLDDLAKQRRLLRGGGRTLSDPVMLQVILRGEAFDKLQAFADELMVTPDDLASQLLFSRIEDLKPGELSFLTMERQMAKESNVLLCVGGPLAGERFAVHHGSGFAVPVRKETLEDIPSDDIKRFAVEIINYRKETFSTDQGSVTFWVPEGQTSFQTISILLKNYEELHAAAGIG